MIKCAQLVNFDLGDYQTPKTSLFIFKLLKTSTRNLKVFTINLDSVSFFDLVFIGI